MLFRWSLWPTHSSPSILGRKPYLNQKYFFFCFDLVYSSIYPQGIPHLRKKISKIFPEKSMSEKSKIHEKVVTHFVEFIGFMVCKTTGSISRSFLLKKIGRKCSVARDICTFLKLFLSLFCQYL